MFTVKTLVELLEKFPLFICKSGSKLKWYEQLILAVILFFASYQLYGRTTIEVTDVRSFTIKVEALNAFLVIVFFFCRVLLEKYIANTFVPIESFYKTDGLIKVSEHINVGYFIIIATIFQITLWTICIIDSLYVYGSFFYLCLFLGYLVVNNTIIQLLILKQVIVKRMSIFAKSIQLSSIIEIRELLDLNYQTNETYSTLLFIAIQYNSVKVIRTMVNLWLHFGIKHSPNNYALYYMWAVIIFCIAYIVILMTTVACTKVSVSVDDVKSQVDRIISLGEAQSLTFRMQMLVIIQELDQMPLDLQCLDLFIFDCASVTSFWSFMLNLLMVFIQFLKA